MQILWQKKVICRTISTLFMKGTKITNVNLVANHLLLTRGYSLNKHINAVHEGHKDFKCRSYDKSLQIKK